MKWYENKNVRMYVGEMKECVCVCGEIWFCFLFIIKYNT